MNTLKDKQRPSILTYLCLGSAFIGLLWVIMLVVLILHSLHGNVPETIFPGLVIEYLNAGYLFVAAFLGLTLLGLGAVVLMWQKKRAGFYVYAASKTALYFMPVAIIGDNHLTFTGLVLTSMGITTYGVLFCTKITDVKPSKTKN